MLHFCYESDESMCKRSKEMKISKRFMKKAERYFEIKQITEAEKAFDQEVERLMAMDKKYATKEDVDLTEEQKKAIDEFWGKYEFAFKPNYNTFKTYMNRTGKFDVTYLPHGIRRNFLENVTANPAYRTAFQNKAYLSKIYLNIKQPTVVIRKIEGIYYDADYNKISLKKAIQICLDRLENTEIVVKPSGLSGGKGVVFLREATEEILRDEFKKIPKLMVVQEAIKQHPDMAKLNPSTVNTVRLTTYLDKRTVVPLAALVKIGNAGVRVDNYKHGGHILGIDIETGHSLPYALNVGLERVTMLPTGIDLSEGIDIPNFKELLETAKKAHLHTPKMKVISWDIAIDEEGDAMIIEANYGGDLRMHQSTTGSVFGDYLEEFLERYLVKRFYRERANWDYNFREYFDHIEITKYAGDESKVVVPEMINGKPVTVIGEKAFARKSNVKEYVLPDTITRIRDGAFMRNKELEKINVPKDLKKKGEFIFDRCRKLSENTKKAFK